MDKILLRGLQISTIIGCLPWERQLPQQVVIDLDLFYDCSSAIASDSLSDALDYTMVVATINEFASSNTFSLVEAFAGAVAEHLLAQYALSELTITVTKPQIIPKVREVGVCLHRRRVA